MILPSLAGLSFVPCGVTVENGDPDVISEADADGETPKLPSPSQTLRMTTHPPYHRNSQSGKFEDSGKLQFKKPLELCGPCKEKGDMRAAQCKRTDGTLCCPVCFDKLHKKKGV